MIINFIEKEEKQLKVLEDEESQRASSEFVSSYQRMETLLMD